MTRTPHATAQSIDYVSYGAHAHRTPSSVCVGTVAHVIDRLGGRMGRSRHCALPATLDLRVAHRGRHLDRSGSKVVFEWNLGPSAKMRNDLRGSYASEPAAFFGRSPGRQTKHNARRIEIARAGSINNGSCPHRGYGNDASARDNDGAQRSAGDCGKPNLGSNEGHGVIPDFG